MTTLELDENNFRTVWVQLNHIARIFSPSVVVLPNSLDSCRVGDLK